MVPLGASNKEQEHGSRVARYTFFLIEWATAKEYLLDFDAKNPVHYFENTVTKNCKISIVFFPLPSFLCLICTTHSEILRASAFSSML